MSEGRSVSGEVNADEWVEMTRHTVRMMDRSNKPSDTLSDTLLIPKLVEVGGGHGENLL